MSKDKEKDKISGEVGSEKSNNQIKNATPTTDHTKAIKQAADAMQQWTQWQKQIADALNNSPLAAAQKQVADAMQQWTQRQKQIADSVKMTAIEVLKDRIDERDAMMRHFVGITTTAQRNGRLSSEQVQALQDVGSRLNDDFKRDAIGYINTQSQPSPTPAVQTDANANTDKNALPSNEVLMRLITLADALINDRKEINQLRAKNTELQIQNEKLQKQIGRQNKKIGDLNDQIKKQKANDTPSLVMGAILSVLESEKQNKGALLKRYSQGALIDKILEITEPIGVKGFSEPTLKKMFGEFKNKFKEKVLL